MSEEATEEEVLDHRHGDSTYSGESTADLEESWNRYKNPSPLEHTQSVHRMPVWREVGTLIHKGINETGNNIPSQGTLTDAWYQRYSGARMYETTNFSAQKHAIRQVMNSSVQRLSERIRNNAASAKEEAETGLDTSPAQLALPAGREPMLALPPGPRVTPMPPAPLTPAQRGRRGGEATAARPRRDLAPSDRQDHAGATRRALQRGFGNLPIDEGAKGVWER